MRLLIAMLLKAYRSYIALYVREREGERERARAYKRIHNAASSLASFLTHAKANVKRDLFRFKRDLLECTYTFHIHTCSYSIHTFPGFQALLRAFFLFPHVFFLFPHTLYTHTRGSKHFSCLAQETIKATAKTTNRKAGTLKLPFVCNKTYIYQSADTFDKYKYVNMYRKKLPSSSYVCNSTFVSLRVQMSNGIYINRYHVN